MRLFKYLLRPKRNSPKMGKILLFSTTGIGNAILLDGVIRKFKMIQHDVSISVMASEGGLPIFDRSEDIHHVYVLGRGWFNNIRLIFYAWNERFDITILAYGEIKIKSTLLSFLLGARERVTFYSTYLGSLGQLSLFTKVLSDNPNLHETEKNWLLFQSVFPSLPNIDLQEFKPKFPIKSTELSSALKKAKDQHFLEDRVSLGILPGCDKANPGKRWPIESYMNLIIRIKKEFPAIQIVVFGGSHEENINPFIETMSSRNLVVNLIGKLSIGQTASIMSFCSYFISNDSALMHIASALDKPVTAIFGPSNERRSGAIGRDIKIIRSGFDCSSCFYVDNRIMCVNEYRCIREVTVESVYASIKGTLKGLAHSS